jgi:predicted DsbA family dithiol-disulfide isomerase
MNSSPARVLIDVWSDYVCPFCYLEQPILDRIRQVHGDAVQVRWRAFELRPDPVPTLDPDGAYLHDIWGRAVYPMARERGMTLRLPPVQPRSRKAMEAAEFARAAGCFERMNEALFRAFFEQGQDIASIDVLVEIGSAVGLDTIALRQALEQGLYTEPVLQDQRDAQSLGISGVPMMVVRRNGQALHEGQGLSGAQPYEAVAAVVSRALAA